jgi:hypothetical protein
MFESGTKIEKEPLVCFKAAPAVNTTASTEEVAAQQYVLVVFVIAIVVVSTLYFFMALIGELSRSCSHFLKVNRTRKKTKKKGKEKGREREVSDTSVRVPPESKDNNCMHNVNPLHKRHSEERERQQKSRESFEIFGNANKPHTNNSSRSLTCSSDGDFSSDNPMRSGSLKRLSAARASSESSESKSSTNRARKPSLSEFKAKNPIAHGGRVRKLATRVSIDI